MSKTTEGIVLWDAQQGEWGLGDRLRGIASGLAIAEELGCRLVVKWVPNRACDTEFESLFDCPKLSTYVRDLTFRDVLRLAPKVTLAANLNMMPGGAFDLFSENPRTAKFESLDHYYERWGQQLRELQPVESVQRTIDTFVSEHFKTEMVAIHLRRTDVLEDCSKAINSGNQAMADERLMHEISAIHRSRPGTGFLLCSDDREYFDVWRNKLEGMGIPVVAFEKSWGGALRQTSIQDALVDLYLIGHCQIILGSVWSSFLLVAEQLNHAELRYL